MTEKNDENTIRILFADDHPLVRRGFRSLIALEPGMELVGEASDGVEAVSKARLLQPDVILIDLVMPHEDGIEAIGEIKKENPEARILVLTCFSEDDKVFPAIKAGALGYLLKDTSSRDLLRAIRDVYQGKSSLHPTIARKLIREISRPAHLPPAPEQLTAREMETLQLVAQGLTNQEIGERLFISERTVSNHVSNILAKLHLANRVQAALYALREGLANLEEK
jgi:NarL family two-component system response regulator LiaR